MGAVLKIRSATLRVDGELYEFSRGPLPKGTPKAVVDVLRRRGALAEPGETVAAFTPGGDLTATPTGGAEGAPATEAGIPEADRSGAAAAPPSVPDAPDVAATDVATLAAFIDSAKLNATATVALAGDSPELAAKVLEAEKVASGGDPRSTVEKPLRKLAATT